jgi:rare lipoprotein A
LRPKLRMRAPRRVYVAACVAMLSVPATAVALTAGQTVADTQSAIQAKLNRHHVGYGGRVTATGAASPTRPEQRVELQYAPAGGRRWRVLAASRVRRDGSFRLTAALERSGLIMVRGSDPAPPGGAAALTTSSAGASSGAQRVTVAAKFAIKARSIVVLGGHAGALRGRLLPAVTGRKVRLEGRASNGRWQLLSTARTGARGGFGLRYGSGDTRQLRVRFAGDSMNTRSSKAAGHVTVFEQAIASWYYDGGNTACGFHARFGVASPGLSCGTKVTFRSGASQVTATVDDRGPFVSGRSWDLNQNTAAALGFAGVGAIWASR